MRYLTLFLVLAPVQAAAFVRGEAGCSLHGWHTNAHAATSPPFASEIVTELGDFLDSHGATLQALEAVAGRVRKGIAQLICVGCPAALGRDLIRDSMTQL